MELVIASHNLHKIRELREMLKPFHHLDILSLNHFSGYTSPPETGNTFEENAVLKATHAAKALGKWVLADDSGLVVPSLKGAPGIHSRRYAGEDATEAENRQKLLSKLKGKADLERSAYFECCLALANPKGLQKCVRGFCEGYILPKEKGRHGFGYDSIFAKNDYEKSFAELDEFTKNRISHRYKALEKIASFFHHLIE